MSFNTKNPVLIGLNYLPVEILYTINWLALNTSLHCASKRLYLTFTLSATPAYTSRFLVLWALQKHLDSLVCDNWIPFGPAIGHSPAVLMERVLKSPLCTPEILPHVHQLIEPLFAIVRDPPQTGSNTTTTWAGTITTTELLGVSIRIRGDRSSKLQPFRLRLPERLLSVLSHNRGGSGETPNPPKGNSISGLTCQTKASDVIAMIQYLAILPQDYAIDAGHDINQSLPADSDTSLFSFGLDD